MSELIVTDSERVESGRTMKTTATSYRDRTLKLKNTSKYVHLTKVTESPFSSYSFILGNQRR